MVGADTILRAFCNTAESEGIELRCDGGGAGAGVGGRFWGTGSGRNKLTSLRCVELINDLPPEGDLG